MSIDGYLKSSNLKKSLLEDLQMQHLHPQINSKKLSVQRQKESL